MARLYTNQPKHDMSTYPSCFRFTAGSGGGTFSFAIGWLIGDRLLFEQSSARVLRIQTSWLPMLVSMT
ncbi:hypothetical protein GBA52_017369 [Prunus armeniaca]|nr:hypothetical protein GBA52_017369 [Prunus armeniaca]